MKTETQIAEEYLEELKDMEGSSHVVLGITRTQMGTHKQSCQRFLEFLESLIQFDYIDHLQDRKDIGEKITDLKQAIKLYREARLEWMKI